MTAAARCYICGAISADDRYARIPYGRVFKLVCTDDRACRERALNQAGQLSLTPEHDPLATADVQLRIGP